MDAHVHLWDPANTEWYPYLSGLRDVGMGELSGWARYFDQSTYFSESANWQIEKFVHVAAASDVVAETLQKQEESEATGHPDAIVGGVHPTDVTLARGQIDRQLEANRFRGVRPMGGTSEHGVPAQEVLKVLQERHLVLDLMAHPDQLLGAATALRPWDGLVVVVEHAGWPRSDTDDEFRLWQQGMSKLAALGPNVHCKLSGLSMPFRSMDPRVLRRWTDQCLELFGVDRCLFGSNFPPDGAAGSLDQLLGSLVELTADLDAVDRAMVFAGNAERVYRC
ncbi:MAG: amidohydrolase family protein [Actinomycetota bacterium]|nr:amidohydrolase family protein [Actinomycetota bacterium]